MKALLTALCLLCCTTVHAGGDCECPDGSNSGCIGAGIGTFIECRVDGAPLEGGVPPGTVVEIVFISALPPCNYGPDGDVNCDPLFGGWVSLAVPNVGLVILSFDAGENCPGEQNIIGSFLYTADLDDVNPQSGKVEFVGAWGSMPICPDCPSPEGMNGTSGAVQIGVSVPVDGAQEATFHGDANGDGVANVADLALFLGAWGTVDTTLSVPDHYEPSEGVIDVHDLIQCILAWN